jgi:hypothetical protein
MTPGLEQQERSSRILRLFYRVPQLRGIEWSLEGQSYVLRTVCIPRYVLFEHFSGETEENHQSPE